MLNGIVYLVNTVGKPYAKLRTPDGKKYRINPREGRNRGLAPVIGDKIQFEPSPIQGTNPDSLPVSWWQFETLKAATPALEAPIVVKLDLAGKINGVFGLVACFCDLQNYLSEEEMRRFCELTLNGEELWRAFRAAQRESGNDDYNFRDYANEVLEKN